MTAYQLLSSLAECGALPALYRAGFINIRCYAQRDIYEHYLALRAWPQYQDDNAAAVRQTAAALEVSVRTVYEAVRVMTQPAASAA